MDNRLTYCLILLLICSKLSGQINLRFEYELTDFKGNIKSEITVTKPDLSRTKLFFDTIRNYEVDKHDFLSQNGTYQVEYKYSINSISIDSVYYSFDVTGNENDIEVRIKLGQDINGKWINNDWTELDRKNRGYISIVKYYKAPTSIHLELENKKSDEYYKGPFFKLINNSKDTIYGEYLPGYFWGSIAYMTKDSIWSRNLSATIDMEFVPLPPLCPDSDRIASVGSFGLGNKLPKNTYKYELLYSINKNFHAYTEYLNLNTTNWWAKTEEFYRIVYIFEIK
jgi:hypothetical protein